MTFLDESTWICKPHVVFGSTLVSLWEHVERKHIVDACQRFQWAMQPFSSQQVATQQSLGAFSGAGSVLRALWQR